jgi:hypothetical protein
VRPERAESSRARTRPVRRRPRGGLVVRAIVVVLVFALGVALGQALEDSDTGGVVTYRRTLSVPDETVTQTVTITVPG